MVDNSNISGELGARSMVENQESTTQKTRPQQTPRLDRGDELPWPGEWFDWSDNPYLLKRVVSGLIILCVVLFLIDLFHHRHAYFSFEESRGFYAIAGFFAFAGIVLLAGQLRRLIKRPENYYGAQTTHAEDYPEAGLERLIDPRWRRAGGPEDSGVVSSAAARTEPTGSADANPQSGESR